jgi:hypothetical protein
MLRELKEIISELFGVMAFWLVLFIVAAGLIITNAKAEPYDASGNAAQVIGGRPDGCPFRYCGCGLRKYLGIHDARLNLAANWARLFHRTNAHPGAAAVRSHHVMLLEQHIGGTRWLVRDYNGGRHLSYLHVRDVRGFIFVQPTSQVASNDRPNGL